MNIGYKLVKNCMAATAEKAPYLGMAIPVGSLAYDNILKEMISSGTKMTQPTAKYFLDALYEFAAERIAEESVRISIGTVSIYPMIDGSFDSEDAEFDPERNSLYVGATLSQSLRDRVAGIVPDSSGESAGGTVKMDRIYDLTSKLRGVITGTDAFRISGRNLAVPDAEDESLALYAKDGVTKVTDIVVTETDGGQLITCQLSAAVGVPKGTYKVRLASHGLDPTDPLTVATLTVTLVEAVPEPVPADPLWRSTRYPIRIDTVTPQSGVALNAGETWNVTGEGLKASGELGLANFRWTDASGTTYGECEFTAGADGTTGTLKMKDVSALPDGEQELTFLGDVLVPDGDTPEDVVFTLTATKA